MAGKSHRVQSVDVMVKQLVLVFLGLAALVLVLVVVGAIGDRYYTSKAARKQWELVKQEAFANGETVQQYLERTRKEHGEEAGQPEQHEHAQAEQAPAAAPGAQAPSALASQPTAFPQMANNDEPPLAIGQLVLPKPDLTITDADVAAMSNKAAVFHTTVGSFVVELYAEKAPVTVKNFLYLVKNGFYNGLYFHRYSPGKFLEVGTPNGRRGGTAGYWFDMEAPDLYPAIGTVSLLPVPDTNKVSSELFILVRDGQEYLDNSTVFGRIIDRYNVAEKIADTRTDDNAYVDDRVYITRVEVVDLDKVKPAEDFWATNFVN